MRFLDCREPEPISEKRPGIRPELDESGYPIDPYLTQKVSRQMHKIRCYTATE